MNYEVNFVREGRGGWAYYREDGRTLPFDWDITADGFEVYLTPSAEWEEFCKEHRSTQCIDRRQEIVERLAEEIRKKEAKTAKVTIDDQGIMFSFKGDRVHSLISWILGV